MKKILFVVFLISLFLFNSQLAFAGNICAGTDDYACRQLIHTSVKSLVAHSVNHDNEWKNYSYEELSNGKEDYITHLLYPYPAYSCGYPGYDNTNGKPLSESQVNPNLTPLIIIHGWQGKNGLTNPETLKKFEHSAEIYWDTFLNYFNNSELKDIYQIYLYKYPSYKHITYNARILEELIGEISNLNNKKTVILAHSMGGLVARSLIEEHGYTGAQTLITLATPHHGSPAAIKEWIDTADIVEFFLKDLDTPGSNDLFWDNYDGVFEWVRREMVDGWDGRMPEMVDFDNYYRNLCENEGLVPQNLINQIYSIHINRYPNPWLTHLNEKFKKQLKINFPQTLYIFYGGQNEVYSNCGIGNNLIEDEVGYSVSTGRVWSAGYGNDGVVPVTSAFLDFSKHDNFIDKGQFNCDMWEYPDLCREEKEAGKSLLYSEIYNQFYIFSWPSIFAPATSYEPTPSKIRFFKDYNHTRMHKEIYPLVQEANTQHPFCNFETQEAYLSEVLTPECSSFGCHPSYPLFDTIKSDLFTIAGYIPEYIEEKKGFYFNLQNSNEIKSSHNISTDFGKPVRLKNSSSTMNFDGWAVNGSNEVFINSNGWLSLVPSDDPQILKTNLSLNPSEIDYIQFYCRNNSSDSTGKVYIKTNVNGEFRSTDKIDFVLENDNRWHLIQINTHDIPGWDIAGKITGIRIDPIENGDGVNDQIFIDYIRFRKLTPNISDFNSVKLHPDGALIKSENSSTVYLIELGKKRPIPNAEAFEAMYFDWCNIVTVSDEELSCYPTGDDVLPITPKLIKRQNTAEKQYTKYYLATEENRKRWILNPKVLTDLGFEFSDVEEVSEATFNSYKNGPKISSIFPEGTIIKDPHSSTVYIISNGEAVSFFNQDVFEKLGYYAVDEDEDGFWDSVMEAQTTPDTIAATPLKIENLNNCPEVEEINVTLNWPLGGEVLQGGTTRIIKYSINDPENVSKSAIICTYDKFQTVQILDSNISPKADNEYPWVISDIPTDDASVEVIVYDLDGRPYSTSPESFIKVESNLVQGQDYFDIFNDGGVDLEITSIVLEHNSTLDENSKWIELNNGIALPPDSDSLVIGANKSLRIPVSVDKEKLSPGSHVETVHIQAPNLPEETIEIEVNVNEEDTAPNGPATFAVTPENWSSLQNFTVDWTNPSDASGIIGGYYKIGSRPTYNTDGVYFDIAEKPLQINVFNDGIFDVWIWLKDGSGNIDYNSCESVQLNRDTTAPHLLQCSPYENSLGVPIETPVALTVKDDISGIDTNTITMKINDAIVDPQITTDGENVIIEYIPEANFDFDATIRVYLKVDDLSNPENFFEKEYEFKTISRNNDADYDGLTNEDEYLIGTDLFEKDTDNDGMPDGWEVENGLNPTLNEGINGADGDIDNNGLTNLQQYLDGAYYSADPAEIVDAPVGTVDTNSASIHVSGTDVTAYRYQLDNGIWEPEKQIDIPIELSGLAEGTHTLFVIGKDHNGYWQSSNEATTATWMIMIESGFSCDQVHVIGSDSSMIYNPPFNSYQYRYGNSIFLNDDTVDIWASAPDPSSDVWDRIEHRRGTISSSNDIQWDTNWTSVLEATPDSRDRFSTCDPSVFYYDNYYYIGYTSTDQKEGNGATSNDIFIARFENFPDGSDETYEKWNGFDWGDTPQPIITYDGDGWGKGQPCFVVNDDVLFIYYTDGGTKVVTVDITKDNWPSLIDESKATVIFTNDDAKEIYGGKPGPFEVKYIDEYHKFIGMAVSNEFQNDEALENYIFICESRDGIHFEPISTSKSYWDDLTLGNGGRGGAHNLGISGDREGHIDIFANNFVTYAYGMSQLMAGQAYPGRWPTYLNPIEFDLFEASCPIISNFTTDLTMGLAPLTVHFSDASLGEINSWQWDFGDGTISSQQSPIHTFQETGTYSVTLTVDSSAGSDRLTKPGLITVTPCTFNITPDNSQFDFKGGTQEISINASEESCSWTVSEDLSWVDVSPASGTGDGSVTLTVAANSGSARSGIVTIGGENFEVSQTNNPSFQTFVFADLPLTIPPYSYCHVYGNARDNVLTIGRGSWVQMLNFPGNNRVTIESDSSFTVHRSGAVVIFEGSDGTVVSMPATLAHQTISLNDLTYDLVISGGEVMINGLIVTTSVADLESFD